MDDFNWTTIIVAFISAGFGSVIGPLINGYTKRIEIQFNNRKELIDNAKKELLKKEFHLQKYIEDECYLKVKPYLSKKTLNLLIDFNNSKITLVGFSNNKMTYYRDSILHDLHEQEKNWELL